MRAARAEDAIALEPASPEVRLRSLVDWDLLARLGYDPGTGVFAPDAEDPVFGFTVCKAAGCEQVAKTSLGLCWRCDQHWKQAGPGVDFASFCKSAPERVCWRRTAALCAVCRTPGHERPVRAHGLCAACDNAMAKRGQTPEEYIFGDDEFPPAEPRPSFGRCAVATCTRFAWRASPALCEQHHDRWRADGRPTGRAMSTWCARQGSVDRDGRVVVISHLPERALLELLYGLQRSVELGHKAKPYDVQTAVNITRAQGASSLLELVMDEVKPPARLFLVFVADQVALALSDRESEAKKDD